jgi:hypothetical protein
MLKYVPLNITHFSTFSCGVPCHGRERGEERERERGRERERKKEEWAVLSPNHKKTHFKKAE